MPVAKDSTTGKPFSPDDYVYAIRRDVMGNPLRPSVERVRQVLSEETVQLHSPGRGRRRVSVSPRDLFFDRTKALQSYRTACGKVLDHYIEESKWVGDRLRDQETETA